MSVRICCLILGCTVALAGWGAVVNGQVPVADETEATADVHGLRPTVPTADIVDRATRARRRGIAFLAETQNPDGSWGSHDPRMANLADFGFQLRNRGAQDAVRTACTAICAEALLDLPDRNESEEALLKRATEELLKVRKFAYQPGESFNSWGYGYKLAFLVRLKQDPWGQAYADRIDPAAESCVEGLVKYQQHEGGWGYYSGVLQDFESMSFNTAFFALSLYRAKQMGLAVPDGMVVDAARTVERQRVPDGSFVYSSAHQQRAGTMLKNLGSGSRTVSSVLALYELGRAERADLARGLEIFDAGENYLESGRKLIQPHSAVHQISGYFFFFGYNYATEVARILADDVPQERWDRFAWTMIRTQEKAGSWWDTPAGDYGDKWGTGFALQCLNRYLAETARRSGRDSPAGGNPS